MNYIFKCIDLKGIIITENYHKIFAIVYTTMTSKY